MAPRFQRPGSQAPSAFGFSFNTDRDTDEPPPVTFNARQQLGLSEQRRRLPVYTQREHFLHLVENHAVVIAVGETGSGKTTQFPQYLAEAGWARDGYQVVCTQPRRMAAVTVASRVAEEVGCALGGDVGFAIRFEDASKRGVTRIKFVTDGVLLREMTDDPLLSAYSVVVVDEAHERSLSTDLLLGLLRKVLRVRSDLRVVVSSATVEAEKVAAFFDHALGARRGRPLPGCPSSTRSAIVTVEGRTYPVQVHYLKAPCSHFINAAVETVMNIHRSEAPGDVLVFLTGQDEVEACVELLQQEARGRSATYKHRLLPLPLFAGLPTAQQLRAFQPTPAGHRRVIVATNIAETSVTLEGVVYVVDALHAKQRSYNPLVGLEALLVAPISKASAAQRAGRAGRVRPGHCFRLCTEAAFQALPEHSVPEIQRSHLAGSILQLKAMGVDNIMSFAWLDAPPPEAAIRGLELLHALGAVNSDARLTHDVGLKLAELPLEAQLGRALLEGGRLGCSEEVATVAAMLGVRSIWVGAPRSAAFEEARDRFAVAEGDLVTYLNVWRAWNEHERSAKWAARNAVHHKAMLRAADIRAQLLSTMARLAIPLASAGDDVASVVQALAAGLFLSAAKYVRTDYDRLKANDHGVHVYELVRDVCGEQVKLAVHESSVLFRCKPQWVLFVSCQQSHNQWYRMQDVLSVTPDLLQQAAPHVYTRTPAH